MGAHPVLNAVLAIIYNTLLLQMPLIVIVLGFAGRRRPLDECGTETAIATLRPAQPRP